MSQESRDIDLNGEVEDTIDPDVVDEMEEPLEEPMYEPVDPQELTSPEGEEVYGLANEFKTVPGVHTQPEPEPEPTNPNLDHKPRRKMKVFYLVTHQSSVQKNLPIIKWSRCQNISVTHSVPH